MRLSAAARYFDRTVCTDAFTPFTQIYGQVAPYDESTRDGVTVERRVLAVAPGTTIPVRRVLLIVGEYWLVGTVHTDFYLDSALRAKYVLEKAQGAVKLQTPAQLLSTGGVDTYGGLAWVKDTKDVTGTSIVEGFFNLYLPSPEAPAVGDIATLAGKHYLIYSPAPSEAGFLMVECYEMPAGALTTGTYRARTYVPATDTLTVATPGTAVNVLQVRFQDSFLYPNAAAEKFADGDIRAFITKAAVPAPKANDVLIIGSDTWQVIAVQSDRDCWNLHCRHASAR